MTFISGTDYTSPIVRQETNLNPIVYRNVTGNMLTDSDIEGLTRTLAVSGDDDATQEFVSRIQAIQSETEHSSFVTKEAQLEFPADGFTIKFDADMAPSAYIIASYKARDAGDDTPFEDLEWTDFPISQIINEENYGPFNSDPDEKNYTMRVDVPFDFTSFKIRLRLGTENEAQIPRLMNLRIIADV